MRRWVVYSVFLIGVLLATSEFVAANTGNIVVRLNGGGANNKAFIGQVNTLEILITNDKLLSAISLAFQISCSQPYTWIKPYGTRTPPTPIVMEHNDAVGKFGLGGGLGVTDRINSITADTFMISGVKDISGPSFPSHGTSALCYSLRFTISPSATPEFYGFCVDNIFMTPSGTWAFVAADGTGSWAPNFQGNHNTSSSDPDAPAVCFDIALPAYMCGDANGDLTVNIGDAVHVINYVFKGGAVPNPLNAGDANCDLARNVGDAVHIINYIFKGGPAPCCP